MCTHPTAEHANGLSLNVWHLTSMVKGHVGGLPIGISSGFGQGLRVEVVGHNLALVWRFRGEQVPRNLLQAAALQVSVFFQFQDNRWARFKNVEDHYTMGN